MGKSVFSIFLIIMLLSSCLLLTLIAAGGEIIISAQADEEGLSSLEAGDILRVTVTLPKVENTNKLQFDLNFNDSVFSYNGDADASAVLSVLAIGKVETVGDGTIANHRQHAQHQTAGGDPADTPVTVDEQRRQVRHRRHDQHRTAAGIEDTEQQHRDATEIPPAPFLLSQQQQLRHQ